MARSRLPQPAAQRAKKIKSGTGQGRCRTLHELWPQCGRELNGAGSCCDGAINSKKKKKSVGSVDLSRSAAGRRHVHRKRSARDHPACLRDGAVLTERHGANYWPSRLLGPPCAHSSKDGPHTGTSLHAAHKTAKLAQSVPLPEPSSRTATLLTEARTQGRGQRLQLIAATLLRAGEPGHRNRVHQSKVECTLQQR